jgi:2-dehydro-3-deoxy-D-gluconate 5-dehydrogenase
MTPSTQALLSLDGRVALVTGAAKGIGRGIAANLAGAGAAVVVADIDARTAEETARELVAEGLKVRAVSCDMQDPKRVEAAIAFTVSTFGSLDILVNNAAIYPMSPITEMPLELWDRVLNTNLRGVFVAAKAAAIHLCKAGRCGRLINISSINTAKSYVGMAHYDASKGGLEAFTRSFALEFASAGVTANVIAPGAVMTPGSFSVRTNLAQSRGEDTTDKVDAEFASRIPLGHWATPAEIGQAVLLLATPAASYITGQTLYVDGGLKLTM